MNTIIAALVAFSILITTKVVTLANETQTKNESQMVKINTISETKTNEGNKLSEINTTWGEFLDLYLKENPDVTYYNPREDINKDRKVRVIKTEYPNGLEAHAGFFGYALIIRVYDSKTDELLTSAGHYRDKK